MKSNSHRIHSGIKKVELPTRSYSSPSDNLLDSYVENLQLFSSPGPAGNNKHITQLNSFRFSPPPLHQSCSMSSPLLPSSSRVSSRAASSPVDVKSVPRVRKISTTKLAYSYTFGGNSSGLASSPSKPGQKRKRSLN